MNTTKHHITRKLVVLVVLGIVLGLFSGCGKGDPTGAAESAIIKYFADKNAPAKSVKFIDKPEVYADSCRSPEDKGTTIKGTVAVEGSDGKSLKFEVKVFVADKDGWTSVTSVEADKQEATRLQRISNLRMIGQAILLYSNDDNTKYRRPGHYPPDLGTLTKAEPIEPKWFISPIDKLTILPLLATPDDAAAWVNQNTSYIYLGAAMNTDADPAVIVAYEKPGLDKDGSMALFGDLHVDFVKVADLQATLARTK